MPRSQQQFDFDDWACLAQRDPPAFEARRRAVLDAFIEQCPTSRRQRLRRLQWRIDRERDRCGTPLAACLRLSDWMWRSFAGDDGLVDSLDRLRGRRIAKPPPRSARLIPFRPRKDREPPPA